ncbi:MAG TPA: cell envelope biogenesis protein TolA, partial [Methylocystis sp.]|nr:cell envelope biogenesis protein TolA [Methylocystis sp.]
MFSRSEPGLPISAALHLGLLAAMLFTFSHAPKFEDALETVAVDVVSDSQINEVSKGEKSAKIAPPAVRAEKAHKVETRPEPP